MTRNDKECKSTLKAIEKHLKQARELEPKLSRYKNTFSKAKQELIGHIQTAFKLLKDIAPQRPSLYDSELDAAKTGFLKFVQHLGTSQAAEALVGSNHGYLFRSLANVLAVHMPYLASSQKQLWSNVLSDFYRCRTMIGDPFSFSFAASQPPPLHDFDTFLTHLPQDIGYAQFLIYSLVHWEVIRDCTRAYQEEKMMTACGVERQYGIRKEGAMWNEGRGFGLSGVGYYNKLTDAIHIQEMCALARAMDRDDRLDNANFLQATRLISDSSTAILWLQAAYQFCLATETEAIYTADKKVEDAVEALQMFRVTYNLLLRLRDGYPSDLIFAELKVRSPSFLDSRGICTFTYDYERSLATFTLGRIAWLYRALGDSKTALDYESKYAA